MRRVNEEYKEKLNKMTKEELEEELEKQDKALDEYIDRHRDYLSEEAEQIRDKIYVIKERR